MPHVSSSRSFQVVFALGRNFTDFSELGQNRNLVGLLHLPQPLVILRGQGMDLNLHKRARLVPVTEVGGLNASTWQRVERAGFQVLQWKVHPAAVRGHALFLGQR